MNGDSGGGEGCGAEGGGRPGEPPIRVIVADDQAIVRDGLATVLGLQPGIDVVGQAADGAEAVALAERLAPDVVLMDLRMPRLDGAAATARLRERCPDTAVLVLTTYGDDASIAAALKAGARGYLTKDAGRVELARAVRAAASGQVTFARRIGERVVAGLTGAAPRPVGERFPALTRREAEVFELVGAGRSNGQIAAQLCLAPSTVKSYVNDLLAKLGVATRAEAVALFHEP